MLTTVEGVYKNGQVELLEKPADVQEARVLVTFVEEANGKHSQASKNPKRGLQYGKYAGPTMTDEEDFKLAEWHGEPEFDDENYSGSG